MTIPKSFGLKEVIAINSIALKVDGNSFYDSYMINAAWYDESVKMAVQQINNIVPSS